MATKHSDSGIKDVSNIASPEATKWHISKAGQEIAMLIALQKREWQELRSTSGVVLKYINLQEPTSKRKVLLVAIGTMDDDIEGNNATLDVTINGLSIDAIVEKVAENVVK
jgi:hypothetical protein